MTKRVIHFSKNKLHCPYQYWNVGGISPKYLCCISPKHNKDINKVTSPKYNKDINKVTCKWCTSHLSNIKNNVELIQMVGLPASGKSTYLKTHYKNCVIVSLDEIRRVFFGHQFHQNAEPFVLGIAKNLVRLLLQQNKSVVIDSTGLLYQFRKEWRNIGNEYNAYYSIVWITTPVETCLKRNRKRPEGKRVPDDVITRMSNQLESPSDFDSYYENIKVNIVDLG